MPMPPRPARRVVRGAAVALTLAGSVAVLPAPAIATGTARGTTTATAVRAATVARPRAAVRTYRTVRVGRSFVRIPMRIVRLNWRALARCESGGRRTAVNPAGYYGLYQFDLRTWRSVGGIGYPHWNYAPQQTAGAQLLYMRRGAQPWPYCGRFL